MNWYKKAQETQKELTDKELKNIAEQLIRGAWKLPYLDPSSKYNTYEIRLLIDSEPYLQEIAQQYGDDNNEKIMQEVENVLIAKEESIFNARKTKLQKQGPLYHIEKAIKNKSWNKAKRALAELSIGGIYSDKTYIPSDNDAEEIFQRLYKTIFQPGYVNYESIKRSSPYIQDNQRYVKRLSEIKAVPYEQMKGDKNGRIEDIDQYNETLLLRHILGWKEDKPPEYVEIYRGVSRADAELRPGDYVTFNREYARGYVRGNVGKIIRQKVKSDDLIIMKLDSDMNEFIYYPRNYTPSQENIQVPMTFKEFYERVNYI